MDALHNTSMSINFIVIEGSDQGRINNREIGILAERTASSCDSRCSRHPLLSLNRAPLLYTPETHLAFNTRKTLHYCSNFSRNFFRFYFPFYYLLPYHRECSGSATKTIFLLVSGRNDLCPSYSYIVAGFKNPAGADWKKNRNSH